MLSALLTEQLTREGKLGMAQEEEEGGRRSQESVRQMGEVRRKSGLGNLIHRIAKLRGGPFMSQQAAWQARWANSGDSKVD